MEFVAVEADSLANDCEMAGDGKGSWDSSIDDHGPQNSEGKKERKEEGRKERKKEGRNEVNGARRESR